MTEGQFWETETGRGLMRLFAAIAKPRHDDRGPQRLATPVEHTKPLRTFPAKQARLRDSSGRFARAVEEMR